MKWRIKQTPFFEACFAEFVPPKEGGVIRNRIKLSLEHEPGVSVRHRKKLEAHRYSALATALVGREVWQLRIDPYRVFYELNEESGQIVVLLLIGEKLNHETTDEMLKRIEILWEKTQ